MTPPQELPLGTRELLTLSDVLVAAEPRPPDFATAEISKHRLSEVKRTYSTRFANLMAVCIANRLRATFAEVLPSADGRGLESPAQSVRGPKKLDVNYSTPQLGLGFGISLKAVHFKEREKFGYVHNRKRNDEELRSEAAGYHKRQPFAVMIAVMFLPDDACEDAHPKNMSSFGAWVKYLRPLSQRESPHDDIDRYERVFIALYSRDGSRLEFFDVVQAPPKRGRPRSLLSFDQFLDAVEKTFLRRNVADFEWADEDCIDTDQAPEDADTDGV